MHRCWHQTTCLCVPHYKWLHCPVATGSMPLCRFANPTALNAASGWLFVNNPENVQYLCATNVRNYGRRYLPDIYKWITHEKGILGSQACLHDSCHSSN